MDPAKTKALLSKIAVLTGTSHADVRQGKSMARLRLPEINCNSERPTEAIVQIRRIKNRRLDWLDNKIAVKTIAN